MDVNDEIINLKVFFFENKDVYQFFKKYFNPIRENIKWPKIVKGDFYCNNNPGLKPEHLEWLKQNCEIKGKIK